LQIISSFDEISVSKIIKASHKSKELDNYAAEIIKLGSNLLVGSILEQQGVFITHFLMGLVLFLTFVNGTLYWEIGDLF
jgi:hypothetical protein